MLCRICVLSTDPTQELIPYHADYTAPTRQLELDHTDHTDQESICPGNLDHQVRIHDLSDVYSVVISATL